MATNILQLHVLHILKAYSISIFFGINHHPIRLHRHQSSPDKAAHLIKGELQGDGPWRIDDYRIRVLGCHNTDPHLADEFAQWNDYLAANPNSYPPRQQIEEIAERLGAKPIPLPYSETL